MKLRKTLVFVTMFLFLTGCAAVRLAGRVSSATGAALTQSADEEEAKRAKLAQGESAQNSREGGSDILTIKKNYTSVKVRTEPSTKKPTVATLTGGDKVEKIEEKKDWVKIRFNIEGDEGEGWIKKDLAQK
jgi:hypothetical protein